MLNSSLRKQATSGWLKENYEKGFSSALKLQKFLFFYEILSKIDGEDAADLNYLKGYANGPVFSDVYGDYFYRKDEFINEVEETYEVNPDIVNEDRAKFSSFLVNILNEVELSDLTHELNIWKSKEWEIKRGIKHVSLDEEHLNENDTQLLNMLRAAYPPDLIDSVEVVEIYDKNFIIKKEDKNKFTKEQQEVLIEISNDESIENPVYVSISESGVVLID